MKKIANTADYLKSLPEDQRAALDKVRAQILAAAPDAAEHFGYGLPGFKLDGHPLIYFGAAKSHCALYGSVPQGFADKLKNYEVSKGTIRFAASKPLPATLVKAIVKAKAVENQLRWPPKKTATKNPK